MIEILGTTATPIVFAALIALATVLVWIAFAPARPARQIEDRLDDYLDRGDIVEATELSRSFAQRVLWPPLRGMLNFLGRLLPRRNVAMLQQMLVRAGNPGGLTPLDFTGLRLLLALLLGTGAFVLVERSRGFEMALIIGLALFLAGYLLPMYWLRRQVRGRQHAIQRALPDALDMLTIGVEAGLAFESALVRVGEHWDNPLTREFRRTVAEMRIGSARNDALRRMAERCDVEDLSTFIAVLIQSSQLGVSIAEVLHSQAATMRVKRRQRAEELARQAGVKMVFPLIFFIFPAMLVVILGPAIPILIDIFRTMGGG